MSTQTFTHALRLGARTLLRDLRAGQLRLLLLSVTLAVTSLTAVGFFADRLKGGLERDARQLLGGDAVLVSDQPAPAQFVDQARSLGLQTASTLSFPTMARADAGQGGDSALVALKAVTPGYPLRGVLTVSPQLDAPAQPARAIPAPGQVWADAALLRKLNLTVGDALLLGDARLRIDRVIVTEPDRGAGFLTFAPRVMLNELDLPATALVQPASRITWRFAVAGKDTLVRAYAEWSQAQIKAGSLRGMRLESLETGRPEMRQTLDRAQKFLNLVALLSALLSAVAVALAARSFATQHLDDCAMLRVLGQSQRTMTLAYAFEFVLVGLLASALGVALGYAVHGVFMWLLAGLMDAALPTASLWPVGLGLGVGLSLLLAFGLPPVLQLAQVPPLRVIRRDMGALRPASVATIALGVVGFALLLLATSDDLRLGGIAVGGFAVAVLLFAALSAAAVGLLRKSVNETTAPRWLVLATRQIAARPAYVVVQISALAVGLLALVLLVLLRTDLIDSWRRATPADAPNRFVINVMPEQGDAFKRALGEAGVQRYDWFPMVRGRLVAINGQDVMPANYSDERAQRLLDREFNLSYSATAPQHNEVVAGQWTGGERGTVSVEQGIAQTLGLKLGDTLRFDVGGMQSEAKITSLRKVDWGSMRVNFYVIYPVAQLENVPSTFISAFRAPGSPGFDNVLVQAFPNITLVDMSASLAQVQGVLSKVIRAIEFLFGFTLAAGLVVLFAVATATREERAREFAIMRALGASGRLLRQVQSAELLGVGLLAGLLASVVASVVGWALARFAFDFAWTASAWVPLVGALAGALLAWVAGWWALREVLRRPVVDTLRRAAQ